MVDWFNSSIKAFYKHRYGLTYIAIVLLVAAAFLYRLNNLTPGPHSDELATYATALNTEPGNFVKNIVFLPYYLLTHLLAKFTDISQLTLRLPSVLVAATILPMLYYVLYIWHSRRIAILGVVLMLSSSWFVSLARFGATDIFYAWGLIAAITGMTIIFHHRRHSTKRLLLLALSGLLVGLSFYSPYVAYVYALALIIAHRNLLRIIKELSVKEMATFGTVALVVILPLLIGIIAEPTQILTLLGLPSNLLTTSAPVLLDHMRDMFSNIFWRSDGSLVTNVGKLPLLGIFGAALAALGMYHYEQHPKNIRRNIVVDLFFALFLLISLDYSANKSALFLPLVFILIAMGAVTLLTQWYRIFPKNPFARSIGLIVVTLFIVINISYDNQRYFSAWARAPETKLQFSDDVSIVKHAIDNLSTTNTFRTVSILANSDDLHRLEIWLSNSLSETITVAQQQNLEPETLADLLIVGPDFDITNYSDLLLNYQKDTDIDTTSILEPQVFSLYKLITTQP